MRNYLLKKLFPVNCAVLTAAILFAFILNQGAKQVMQVLPVYTGSTIIIDAGHGFPDGGATSCTGVLESTLNLEISEKMNNLFHLFGINTRMTRENQDSIYTQGDTIAKKKISDTRNRVAMINGVKNGILLSIHQNHYYESQYYGAQVFYANNEESKVLAQKLQNDLITYLNPDSKRQIKRSSGVYLMEHVQCTGVLIECGFLSNPREEALLRSEQYQKKLSSVIVTSTLSFLNQNNAS